MATSEAGARYAGNDQSGHADTRELLPSYAAAMTLGQVAQARFPQVAQHIDHCVECQAELTKLLQLIEPIYDGTLDLAEKPQAFDLSFLTAPATSPVSSQEKEPLVPPPRFGAVERLVLILDQQLEVIRKQWSAAFGRPGLMQARGAPLVDYDPDPATTGGMNVSVQIYPSDADPTSCDLQFALVLPEDVHAPNGIALTLQVDDQTWNETTDESGLFIFVAAVSPDATTLRITADIVPE